MTSSKRAKHDSSLSKTTYQLIEAEYQVRQFRENDPIESLVFPELNLTAKEIFRAGEIA